MLSILSCLLYQSHQTREVSISVSDCFDKSDTFMKSGKLDVKEKRDSTTSAIRFTGVQNRNNFLAISLHNY